jgi:hypothetical protein
MDWIIPFIPTGLLVLGQRLQRRDKNRTGTDDALGRALVLIGPVAALGLSDTDTRATIRTLKVARDGLDVTIRELEAAEAAE